MVFSLFGWACISLRTFTSTFSFHLLARAVADAPSPSPSPNATNDRTQLDRSRTTIKVIPPLASIMVFTPEGTQRPPHPTGRSPSITPRLARFHFPCRQTSHGITPVSLSYEVPSTDPRATVPKIHDPSQASPSGKEIGSVGSGGHPTLEG